MPIERRSDGFLHWADATHAPALGIESDRLDACLGRVRATGTRGVFGTRPYFAEDSLDFLRELEHIEAVAFWDVGLRSVDGLRAVSGLRFLRLTPQRPVLDFTLWPALRTLVWDHHPGDTGHESLSELEELRLWGYRPAPAAPGPLCLPQNLKRLSIYRSGIRRLAEIARVDSLESLTVVRCPKLERIGDIRSMCPNLKRLDIGSCSGVSLDEAKEALCELPSITHCSVNGHLVMGSLT